MERITVVTLVFARSTPEVSIRQLVMATRLREPRLSRSALQTLIQLTAMAHPTVGQDALVGGTFPTADLKGLEFLGYLKFTANGDIELT